MLVIAILVLLINLVQSSQGANNLKSIRKATEQHLLDSKLLLQNNWKDKINSGEFYSGCSFYDSCDTYIRLCTPGTTTCNYGSAIPGLKTSETPWHLASKQTNSNLSKCVEGFVAGSHSWNIQKDGSILSELTCPKFNKDWKCNFNPTFNDIIVKYPKNSNFKFGDQTSKNGFCMSEMLGKLWRTRVYSNCLKNSDCSGHGGSCLNGVCNGDKDSKGKGTIQSAGNYFHPSAIEGSQQGDQNSGIYAQFPGLAWDQYKKGSCNNDWDPRFRPWYAIAATGPKDVYIVIDKSGSMGIKAGSKTRFKHVQNAAIRVLDTLTTQDYATVISFSNSVDADGETKLRRVNNRELCKMKKQINELSPSGGTDFKKAFEKTFTIGKNSKIAGTNTKCQSHIVLFLTDGEAPDPSEVIKQKQKDEDLDLRIFTYAFGDGVSQTYKNMLREIAYANEGIAYTIADSEADKLSTIMAGYYNQFTMLEDRSNVITWIDQIDSLTGQRLFAAVTPIYDVTVSGSKLLGVVAVDIGAERILNITNSTSTKDVAKDGYDWKEWQDESNPSSTESMFNQGKKCRNLNQGEDKLENIRFALNQLTAQQFSLSQYSGQCKTSGVDIHKFPKSQAECITISNAKWCTSEINCGISHKCPKSMFKTQIGGCTDTCSGTSVINDKGEKTCQVSTKSI